MIGHEGSFFSTDVMVMVMVNVNLYSAIVMKSLMS